MSSAVSVSQVSPRRYWCDPALGPKLPKIGDGPAAGCAAGADHGVSGVVQDVGQPDQDRWAAGITGGQRIRVGVYVPSQLLEEPRRTAHRDRHRRTAFAVSVSRAGTAAVKCVIAELIAAAIRAAC